MPRLAICFLLFALAACSTPQVPIHSLPAVQVFPPECNFDGSVSDFENEDFPYFICRDI